MSPLLLVTPGVLSLPATVRAQMLKEHRFAARDGYDCRLLCDSQVLAERNETGGYTFMLPEGR
jgi:hypothetical protein